MRNAPGSIGALIDAKLRAARRAIVGLTPGYYPNANITVDAYGTVRAISAGGSATFAKYVGTTPTINDSTLTRFDFSTDTAGWLNPSALSEIIIPASGRYMVVVQPYWVTTNLVGDRGLDMSQIRDSVSSGYVYDNRSFIWPALNTSALATHSSQTWLFDCLADDKIVFDNWHNGGVNTLKCKLDAWVHRLT